MSSVPTPAAGFAVDTEASPAQLAYLAQLHTFADQILTLELQYPGLRALVDFTRDKRSVASAAAPPAADAAPPDRAKAKRNRTWVEHAVVPRHGTEAKTQRCVPSFCISLSHTAGDLTLSCFSHMVSFLCSRALSEIIAFIEAPERYSTQKEDDFQYALLLDVFKYAAKKLHKHDPKQDLLSEFMDAVYSHRGQEGNNRLGGTSRTARYDAANALQKFFDLQFQSPNAAFMAVRWYISKHIAHMDKLIPELVRIVLFFNCHASVSPVESRSLIAH